MGSRLETIVFLELLRWGYELYVGRIGATEVDFIAIRSGVKEYYQVSYSVVEETTYQRKVSSLREIKDDFRKIILTTDPGTANDEGIEIINLMDWLIKE